MPQIQIELSEVEALKSEISSLNAINKELNSKLKSLDEEQLRKNACYLAEEMFTAVMVKIFNELGIDSSGNNIDCNFANLNYRFGKSPWDGEKLNVIVGAKITQKFKEGYIRLGIKTDNQ